MNTYTKARCFVLLILLTSNLYATINFTAPDTVCLGQNITISNTSTGQSTNLWNFCKQQLIQGVTGVNLGAITGMPARPHGIEIYKEGSNYIGFLGNDGLVTGTSYPIVRLNFGSSILNTPTTTQMPSFSENVTPRFLSFIKEGSNWYAIVVGQKASYQPDVLILSFGNSLLNTPTILKDHANFSGLLNVSNLTGVALEKSGTNVVAFVTTDAGRLFRINFGTTITNLNPVAVDLGTFSVLSRSNRFKLLQLSGNWYGFTANDGYPNSPTDDKLIRFSFGTSLLNTPTVTDLGNPNNKMNRIYDLLVYNDCESVKLLGVNVGNSELISISFPQGLTSNQVTGVSFGNVGSLSSPAGISQIIIENGKKYVIVANSQTNSLTRFLVEPSCNPIGVPSSNATNPPVFRADSLGVMTVSLTIDKNLSTEASTCQEIVVIDTIKKPDARINTITCTTDSIRLTIANIDPTATYSWTGPNGFTSIKSNVSIKYLATTVQNGNYIVTTTGRCGTKKDTVTLNISCVVCTPSFTAPDTVCLGQNITITNNTNCQSTNLWNFCKQELIQGVTGVNLGVITGMPARPHGIEIYKEGSNYIGFLGNDGLVTGTSYPIVRLNFGSSILNVPTTTQMPSFTENVTPRFLRFIQEGSNWYAIVVGQKASYQPDVLVLSFGNSLLNTPTILKDHANFSGLLNVSNLTGVALEKSGANVVAFVTTDAGRLFRINFGATITNLSPVAVDLGTFGILAQSNRIKLLQLNGNWYGFTANDGYPSSPTNDKLIRLSFGTSLLNTPTVTNLGNPNNKMNRVYDLLVYNDCESVKLLGVNVGNSELISIAFPQGLTSNQVTGVSFGNVGSLAQPAGISQIIIENGKKYVIVANSQTKSLTRLLVEPACNPIGVPSSNAINPPVFRADSLGVMTVSLTIDKNLSTEASTCQEIVVIDTIKKPDARINIITCTIDSIRLTIANIDTTATYSWIGPNGFTSTKSNVSIKFLGTNVQNGNYIVTTTGRCGVKKDTVALNISCVVCTPSFIAPDTVCVKQNVILQNQTTCATSNYWNFCSGNLSNNPSGTNLGNPNNQLNSPVYIELVSDNNVKYAFVVNHVTASGSGNAQIVRLKYGSNYLNTPTVTNFGDLGIVGNIKAEGIQIKKDVSGNWFGFFCTGGEFSSKIVRMNFGNSLDNTPSATDLGTIGNLNFPGGLYLFQEGNNWYGFITNAFNNTLVRLSFGTSLSNTPTATNITIAGIGNLGEFAFIEDAGNKYSFINSTSSRLVSRLSFGTSYLNTPTIQSYSIPVNSDNYGIKLLKDCGGNFGYISHINNTITKMEFPNGITSVPIFTNIGNIGTLNFPHSISNIFRVGDSVYMFIPNVNSNTLSRLVFGNCTNSSVPSSTQQNPPIYSYNQPGVFNVSITIDEGLPTQNTICKQIVVIDTIKKPDARINSITCTTDSIRLTIANIDPTATYSWTGPNGFTSIKSNVSIKFIGAIQAGQYIVTATGRCGTKKDTVSFVAPIPFIVNLGRDTSICQGQSVTLNATTAGTVVTYLWSTGAVTPTINVNQVGTYFVKVTADGCSASDTIKVTILTAPTAFNLGNDTTYCGNFTRILSTGNANTVWSTGVTAAQITVTQAGTYIATITNSCGFKKDTIIIRQNIIPLVNLGRDTSICQGQSVTLNATTAGTIVTYLWSTGAVTPTISVNQAGTYFVKVTADGCSASDTIKVTILTAPTAFNLGNDTTYCGSFSRILSTGNANTVWSTGATSAQITVTQAGTYIATITNSCGFKKDTIIIRQNIIPLVNLGRDTSICQGQSVTLNATTSGTVVTYLWSTGAVTPTISVNQAGTYFVKVTADGCSASDTIKVTILTAPNSFNLGNDTTYCGSFSRILSTGNANTVWSTGATSAQITVTQAGTYIATITNSCGFKKDTIIIRQNNIPLVNLGRDTSICQGQSVTLNATTAGTIVTYLWSTGAVTPTINVNQAGTYFVKVTADGCSASDTIKVTILTAPTAFNLGNDTTYCGSFSRILSTGNANTVWTTGATAAQITVTQAGTYIATITNSCGFKKDTIIIKQNNIPIVNLGRDTSICQGQSVTLNATTAGTIVTYLWSTGAVTPTINVNQAGTYFVKVTADGCSASDTIKVTILTAPTAFNLGNDTTYCGSFSRILSTGNANTVWSTGATAAQITVTQAGTYIATVSNICGSETDSISIIKNELPTVIIDKDTIICDGNSLELTAITDAQQYIWNTGDTTKNITITQHGIYWVNVSSNNCVASDTAYIDECEGDLWVPNAFTPNNDQVNDVFQIFGKQVVEYKLVIFNRWGEKLFESNDLSNSWNGTYKDEVVQVDSYAWVIFYKINLNGKVQDKMKKGSVTVLR